MPFDVEIPTQRLPLPGNVEVTLRTSGPSDVEFWEREWRPRLAAAMRPDAEWSWRDHVERAEREAGYLCLTLARSEAPDAMTSLSLAESRLTGDPLIYVEYLGVAPQHQSVLGMPEIRGFGTLLARVAMTLSHALGFHGRIGLHSKPEADGFYRTKLNLIPLGPDLCEDGVWEYFEATADVADRWLVRLAR